MQVKAGGFQVIGTSLRRKDGPDKVTGRAQYAADMLLPGMLHAAILRPPAHGATVKSADTSAAEKMSGVRVVKDGGMIAVLHERPDVAVDALGKIKADWENPPAGPDDKTIFDHIQKTAPQPRVVGHSGDLAEGERLASSVIEEHIGTVTLPTLPSRRTRRRRKSKTARRPCGPVRKLRSRCSARWPRRWGCRPRRCASFPATSAAGSAARPSGPGSGSGAPGEDHRQTGPGGLQSSGGVFLRPICPAAVMKIRAAVGTRSCCGTTKYSGRGIGKPIRFMKSRTSG